MTNKTIFVLPGASCEVVDSFIESLDNKNNESLVTNIECKMFKLIEGELFEVVQSLEKVEGIGAVK